MALDVALDANVIVGYLDPGDSQHARAALVVESLRNAEVELVLLDFIVEEALSVICRRARERKSNGMQLLGAIDVIKTWYEAGRIQTTGEVLATAFLPILEVVKDSLGALNVNDAKLVFLQRSGLLGAVATFDANLAATPDFHCVPFSPPTL